MRKKAEKTKQHMRGKRSDRAEGAMSEKKGGEKKGADEKKKSEKARAWRRFVERCRQKQGAGSESRPRKKKEGGAWKWAMRAFTGASREEQFLRKMAEKRKEQMRRKSQRKQGLGEDS